VRGGHKLNHAVLAALLSDPTAWAIVEQRPPARPLPSHAEAGLPLTAGGLTATP
jgi:UDP-3-O-[3-hydroxymyristoyl] N-acetylglucosamine deacetylase